VNGRTLRVILLCWLPVTRLAGADSPKGVAAETSTPGEKTLQYEEPRYLAAAIYAPDKQLLFNCTRVATRSGSTLTVVRNFSYPDGKLAARGRVVYSGDLLVSYRLEELQTRAVGSVTLRRAEGKPPKGSIEFEYSKGPAAPTKKRSEPLREPILIADMVGPFLASHWEALAHGEKITCRYIVIPRRETVGFTFSKTAESAWQGQPVLIIRMGASSPLVAALIDPLVFTIEKAPPHRVLQYSGRTTPKVQVRGEWKDMDAVTVFDWTSAR
jgi:hypothetical protein